MNSSRGKDWRRNN